ncbi:hypothetical protein [Lacticaseibacillus yichunensis]|uniref:Uncharacterized protein n=1 Tax=Lacticaseibacillus yichunensis TaxID=2486015 RepID=A0ABW4CMP5_9LACO|nr:hypothetical protein [Lacticaseibacillus yichunensis]
MDKPFSIHRLTIEMDEAQYKEFMDRRKGIYTPERRAELEDLARMMRETPYYKLTYRE